MARLPLDWLRAGVLYEDQGLRHKVEEHLGLHPGPDLTLPPSGARVVTGAFQSRYMKTEVGHDHSLPPKAAPGAIVLSLYGKGGDQTTVFDWLHLADAGAYVGAPLAIASANGGSRDSYWHRRANGTDAHAMLVEEFVPLLTDRLGRMPPCALRLFHGRLRCALGSGAGSCPRGREPLLGGGGGQPAALDLARTDGPGCLSLSGITTTTAPAGGPLESTRQYNFAASPADRREAIDGTETTIANDTCECWAMVRAPAQSSRKVPSLRTPARTR